MLRVDPVDAVDDRLGRDMPNGSRAGALRARSMLSETRATTVVSHAPRFSTSLRSSRLSVEARPPARRRPPRSASRASGRPLPEPVLELLRHPLAFVHRSRSSVARGHTHRPAEPRGCDTGDGSPADGREKHDEGLRRRRERCDRHPARPTADRGRARGDRHLALAGRAQPACVRSARSARARPARRRWCG